MDIAPGALDELLAVDPGLWRAEFEGLSTYLSEFGARVPPVLAAELAQSLERVAKITAP